MAILVTGGAGYIGSHTVAELLEAKEEVVIIDNLQKGHKQAVLGGAFYEGDLRDEAFLDKVFKENDIEAVVHFAADSLVGESVKDPLKYYNNNVVSTLKLLTKMNEYNVKKIVFHLLQQHMENRKIFQFWKPTGHSPQILTARQNLLLKKL